MCLYLYCYGVASLNSVHSICNCMDKFVSYHNLQPYFDVDVESAHLPLMLLLSGELVLTAVGIQIP